jgi:hypothetical protein
MVEAKKAPESTTVSAEERSWYVTSFHQGINPELDPESDSC